MRQRWSPNVDDRPPGCAVDTLILHYTGMPTAAAALQRLCDPAAKVSAHYLIDEDGSVVQLVPEERRAWHAGVSGWHGRACLNDCSIGIELVNPGHEWGYRPFPEAQYAACIELCREILGRWRIPPHRVLAHSDVAPARKQDPGELFDWARLGAAGVGLWPPSGAGASGAGAVVSGASPRAARSSPRSTCRAPTRWIPTSSPRARTTCCACAASPCATSGYLTVISLLSRKLIAPRMDK